MYWNAQVITDNCKEIKPEYQPTTVWMAELRAVLEMTTTCLHTSWKTSTLTHSCSNDSVIQLGPLSSDVMFEVIKISDACFVQLLLQDAPHAAVFQLVWRWVVVILWALLLILTFEQLSVDIPVWFSCSCQLWLVRFNTWRSFNSQGKVVTLIRCGGLLLC